MHSFILSVCNFIFCFLSRTTETSLNIGNTTTQTARKKNQNIAY